MTGPQELGAALDKRQSRRVALNLSFPGQEGSALHAAEPGMGTVRGRRRPVDGGRTMALNRAGADHEPTHDLFVGGNVTEQRVERNVHPS